MGRSNLGRLCTVVIVIACLAPWASAANPDDFEILNYDLLDDGAIDMPGRLLVPQNYNPAQQYPLVLFLHGSSERGSDNTKQVNNNIDNLVAKANERGFFVYAPQITTGWNATHIARTMRMIEQAAADYAIDRSRLYVTGLSMGGGGTWQAGYDYAPSLAALVPIAGNRVFEDDGKLVGEPVWTFHSNTDPIVNVTNTRNIVNAVRAADGGKPALEFRLNDDPGNPYYNQGEPYYDPASGDTFYDEHGLRYTEYGNGGHNAWSRAYGEDPLYDWMLAQTNPQQPLAIGQSILIDFSDAQTPAAPPRTWNTADDDTCQTTAFAVPFMRDSDGDRTGVSLEVAAPFTGASTEGIAGGLYPDEVHADAWALHTGDGPAAITLHGLQPGHAYQLRLLASRQDPNDGNDHITRFIAAGEARDLDAADNETATALFAYLIADLDGTIMVEVDTAPGSTQWAYMNALELTAIDLPGDLNGDGQVTFAEVATVVGNLGLTGASPQDGDLDGDGWITPIDADAAIDMLSYEQPQFAAVLMVPEPAAATIALLGVGLLCASGRARRSTAFVDAAGR